MSSKSLKIPTSYNLYLQYIEHLKSFYDIINNSQYKHQILPDGTIYYKDLSEAKWHKITPPKFVNRQVAIANLITERQNLLNDILQLGVYNFMAPPSQVDSSQITLYNQHMIRINDINNKITQLEGLEINDVETFILNELDQKNQLMEELNEILDIRNLNYTFNGQTIEEYQKWRAEWILTEKYTVWKEANLNYYNGLVKLNTLDTEIIDHINLQNKLEEFNKYNMLTLPEYEITAQGPPAVLPKTQPIIKPTVPTIAPAPAPKKIPITMNTKTCKPDDKKATTPGHVCSPDSGVWVKIDGAAAAKILNKYPLDSLKISTGTDTNPYKSFYKSTTEIPAPIPVSQPKIEAPKLAPPEVKAPAKIAITIKPKIEVKQSVPTEVKATTPSEIKVAAPVEVKAPSKKDAYTTIINQQIQSTDSVKGKLSASDLAPILKQLNDKNTIPEYPSVKMEVNNLKNTPAYTQAFKAGLNYNAVMGLISRIYKEIKNVK